MFEKHQIAFEVAFIISGFFVFLGILLGGAIYAFADAILTTTSITSVGDTVSGSVDGTNGTVYGIFFNPDGSYGGAQGAGSFSQALSAYTSAGSGAYHFVGSKGGSCVSGTYSACIVSSDFTISDTCLDVGGSFCNPPAPSSATATTTDDYSQSQENLFHAILLFLSGFIIMVWLIRKH